MKALNNWVYVKFMQLEIGLLFLTTVKAGCINEGISSMIT